MICSSSSFYNFLYLEMKLPCDGDYTISCNCLSILLNFISCSEKQLSWKKMHLNGYSGIYLIFLFESELWRSLRFLRCFYFSASRVCNFYYLFYSASSAICYAFSYSSSSFFSACSCSALKYSFSYWLMLSSASGSTAATASCTCSSEESYWRSKSGRFMVILM